MTVSMHTHTMASQLGTQAVPGARPRSGAPEAQAAKAEAKDRVLLSPEARRLARRGGDEVELQLSPKKLRELATGADGAAVIDRDHQAVEDVPPTTSADARPAFGEE